MRHTIPTILVITRFAVICSSELDSAVTNTTLEEVATISGYTYKAFSACLHVTDLGVTIAVKF